MLDILYSLLNKILKFLFERKKKKEMGKIEKFISNIASIPQLPKPEKEIDEQFISNVKDVKKIIEQNKKSVLLESKSDYEFYTKLAEHIVLDMFNQCIKLKDISKELFLAASLVRAKLSVIDLEKIEKQIDLDIVKNYSTNYFAVEKLKLDKYYEQLLNLAEYGFFNSIFLFLILPKHKLLKESIIEKFITKLVNIGKLSTHTKYKNFPFKLHNKTYSLFFVNIATDIGQLITEVNKISHKKERIVIASWGLIPNTCNLNTSCKLDFNHVEWDKISDKNTKEWRIALRCWGISEEIKEKYELVDKYLAPEKLDDVINKSSLLKFSPSQENIEIFHSKIIKNHRYLVERIIAKCEDNKNSVYVERSKKE